MLRYAITDRLRFGDNDPERREALLRGGERWGADAIDLVQLRENDLSARDLADLAGQVLSAIRQGGSPSKLLINSRADVAIAVGADGVHLTSASGSLTPQQIRSLYAASAMPEPIVSISCHTLEQVATARNSGATLILFGPVVHKRVFDRGAGQERLLQGTGFDLLRAACITAGRVPVLALGGTTEDQIPACLDAGAAGIAAIRLFSTE